MQFKDGLLFDHHVSNPSISHRENKKETNHSGVAEVKVSHTCRKCKEHASSKNVHWPFDAHLNARPSSVKYLRCFGVFSSGIGGVFCLCSVYIAISPTN
tara:strand:- start:417 stop:713 length:297 start_codon:yes stop_codon:yes gene_type:complete